MRGSATRCLRRDNLAKTRWRFKQNHLPEKVCPALVMVIHELETVQGASLGSAALSLQGCSAEMCSGTRGFGDDLWLPA